MKAELVYKTGMSHVNIPSVLKAPRDDQMQGTVAEQLIELCGRICYDSLGTGRDSKSYQKHLFESGHYSVHEHWHFGIKIGDFDLCPWIGIPDVILHEDVLVVNLRHCLEWPDNVTAAGLVQSSVDQWTPILKSIANLFMQMANPFPDYPIWEFESLVVESPIEYQSWFLEDSRVWSHEMVRHRFNMSQRSGRFCDETDRPMCVHPLLRDALNDNFVSLSDDPNTIGNTVEATTAISRGAYMRIVDYLQEYAESKGLDKHTARKQARSAARYYLGNGLSTEMIFTAPRSGWESIKRKRVSPGADAAIRELMDTVTL